MSKQHNTPKLLYGEISNTKYTAASFFQGILDIQVWSFRHYKEKEN